MAGPFDLEAQSQEIQRKRKLAEALYAQTLQGNPGKMVGGHYVGGGVMNAVDPIARALIGNYATSQADQQQKAYGDEYSKQLGEGVDKYLTTRDGAPGETLDTAGADALMNQNQNPTLQEPVAADPRRAVVEAMTSRIPELQAVGKTELAGLLRKPGADYKEHLTQDGTLVRTTADGKVVNMGNFAKPQDKYSAPYTIKGADGKDLLVRRNETNGKVESIGGGGTTVNVGDKVDTEFGKAVSKKRAEQLEKSYESATAASKGLEAISNAADDLDAGIKSGAPAKITLAIAKWGKALGLSDDPAIINTEAYRANMARETFQLIKNLGSGTAISNTDLVFADKASGGEITLDDASMARLLDIAQAASANVMLENQRLVSTAAKATPEYAGDLEGFRVPINFKGSTGVEYDPNLRRFTVKPRGPSSIAQPSAPDAGAGGFKILSVE